MRQPANAGADDRDIVRTGRGVTPQTAIKKSIH
jgi:hypothetical protein